MITVKCYRTVITCHEIFSNITCYTSTIQHVQHMYKRVHAYKQHVIRMSVTSNKISSDNTSNNMTCIYVHKAYINTLINSLNKEVN